jgi:hypothetical protein
MSTAFPVNSATACLLKWGWSTLFLYTGHSNSCHRTRLSSITPDQVATFHNTADKRRHRELMLRGDWPERGNGCEYCKDIEDAGGTSDRVKHAEMLEVDQDHRQLIPPELLDDPTAIDVTPTMLEVYFTNRCNMSCIYCGPGYSSQWVAENRIHGEFPHHTDGVTTARAAILDREYPTRLAGFWRWLEQHHRSLRVFNILGGEPFYQKETEDAIQFWADHPNPDLHLTIFSNLKVARDKFAALLSALQALHRDRRCRSVSIMASLDCWGPEQEYVRHGLDLQNWQQNFEYLISEHPWAGVSINSTINALSLRTMPELLRKVQVWQARRAEISRDTADARQLSLGFNLLLNPRFLSAGIFPAAFFDREFTETIGLLADRSPGERANIRYMEGIWKAVNSTPHDPAALAALKGYLDAIDFRRGTDWRTTFPWLIDVC